MSRHLRCFTLATIGSCFVCAATGFAQPATQAASAASPPAQASAPAQTAAAADTADTGGSLFAPRWNTFQLGGRVSSVSGDPARFQRYEDIRDGILFNGARVLRETDLWSVTAGADNVGWRDQRFFANYERVGRLTIAGLWDQIPQFYSIDTRTPYTDQGGALVLDDAAQRAIQTGQGTTASQYISRATQFDLHERRDIGQFDVRVTPTREWDVTAALTTTKHSGELPFGASFGFGNDVEVPLPYDSRTNDFTAGAEWTNTRGMVRVAYDGSWFNNLDDTLIWDSPLRIDDASGGPSRGRMALWPSNTAQTVSTSGYLKLARRTQVTGFVSFGVRRNDEPLLPFTINTALTTPALPRATADAEARVFSTNLNLVSRPAADWRVSARLRRFDYNNRTHTSIPQFVSYDSSLRASPTGGPEPFSHDRTTFDADATWTGLLPVALTVGFTRQNSGHEFRIFESTAENALHLKADAVGSSWVTFRAHYELADRSGDGLDETLLTEIGEQPALRHFDIANRQRHRFTGQVDLAPNDWLSASLSAGLGRDDYDESYFGLQESTFRVFTFGVDAIHPNGLGVGGSYDYERYFGVQRSRSATPGAQAADPLRDWATDSTERVHYFSFYVTPPRIGRNTEARLSYDYAHARSNFLYTVVPGGPLPAPAQLPEVFNKLQELRLDVRHRLTNRLAATVSYLYEPFDVYDFAFDRTVIDSIVQPSSLILGYLYRPYTAHSAVVGLMYSW